jgi:hypothetical protein
MSGNDRVENDGGILSWEHDTDYGFRYRMTLYTNNCNHLDFEVIRLADHRKVFGVCREHKRWETAVERFERTKADILDPDNPTHEVIQRKAKEYYPI